jgi:hypothetical protein
MNNIDKDENNYTKHSKCSNIPVHEVINLDSTDDEEGVQSPGREKLHPSGAMNGGDLHTEQLETASPSHAGLAQGAMNGSDPEDEDAPMWDQVALHRSSRKHPRAISTDSAAGVEK